MTTPARWLEVNGAQHDLVAWAERHPAWSALWEACPRADWLLAIATRRGAATEVVARAARAVATLALDHVEGDERTWLADALQAPSTAAADAIDARAEHSTDPAHQLALSAVALAVRGEADLPSVAAMIAQAAAMDAADCGMGAAVSYAQRRGAELVREVLPDAP